MSAETKVQERGIPIAPQCKGTVLGRRGQGIRYWIYGDKGRPVIFCNSLFGSVGAWSNFVSHFARTHRLVLWEYQGHGLSSGTAEEREATVRSFAADALLLLDGVGFESAIFVGQGFGVQVILEAYRSNPQRVLSIVGISGVEEGRFSGLAPWQLGSLLARCLETVILPLGVPLWRVVRAVWAASVPFRQDRGGEAGARGITEAGAGNLILVERIARTDPWIGIRILASMLFYHPGTLLPRMSIPVLILGGTEDQFVSAERYAEMAGRIPRARLVLLQGCSHRLLEEEPARLSRVVEDFLAEQGLA
jgi:3-oxoadipate enol-lactonase